VTNPLTSATLTPQSDGYTVNGVAVVTGERRGLVFSWGDGFVSETHTDDPTASHVYARQGKHEVIVACGGYQRRQVVTTTADAPAPKSRYPGTPEPPEVGGPGRGTYTFPGSRRRSAPTGPGLIVLGGPQDNPVTIWISVVDASGFDQSARIAILVSGSVLRIEQEDDPTRWAEYVTTGPPVPDGVAVRLDSVVHWNQGGLLAGGALVVPTGRPGPASDEAEF
jgi:hypothetical protein